MIQLHESTISRTQEIMLLANTPRFLFHRIISEGVTAEIATQYSTEDILSDIDCISQTAQSRVDSDMAARAFLLAISIGHKSPADIDQLGSRSIPWLMWWQEILDLVEQRATSDTHETARILQVPRTLSEAQTSDHESSTVNESVNLGGINET